MKNKHLSTIFNSTLSCSLKCLRFFSMIHRKIFIGLFLLGLLSACGAPTAMLGPAYTFTSTGSWAQAGLTYGSNELVTSYTGKTHCFPVQIKIRIDSTMQVLSLQK